MTLYIPGERCLCGKKWSFVTSRDAGQFIKNNTHLYDPTTCRPVRCNLKSNIFHVTSKSSSNLQSKYNRLAKELHQEMTTLKEFVILYMQRGYEDKKKVNFTVDELEKEYVRRRLGTNPKSLQTVLGQLKRTGVVVDIQKKHGSTPGIITLAAILEKETAPKEDKEEVSKVPEQKTTPTPITVAANPFDKVNSQLGELLSKVDGLVRGYTEVSESLRNGRSSTPVEIDASIIADAVNLRLTDLTKEDSMIYRVREEVADITDRESKWIVENISVPESVSNSEDYRAGVKEGIRLAVEMNLGIRE